MSVLRRLGPASLTGATVLAVVAVAVVAAMLGARFDARLDLTAAGDQSLAPRLSGAIGRATQAGGGFEIVLVADRRAADPQAWRAVGDVLDLVARAGDAVRVTRIDAGSPTGIDEYRRLVDRLVERDRPELELQAARIAEAGAFAVELADWLEGTLAPARAHVASLIEPRPTPTPTTAAFRGAFRPRPLAARQRRDAARRAAAALAPPQGGGIALPRPDEAAPILADALAERAGELAAIAQESARFAVGGSLPGAADAARPIAPAIAPHRDRAASTADALRRLPRPGVLRVAGALESAEALLAIGPPGGGIAAVDAASLLAPGDTAVRADTRARAQELVAGALAALVEPARPVVVIVHGEATRFTRTLPVFTHAIERLERRGIDVLEWAPVLEPDPPHATDRDRIGSRPVVYVVISPDSSASSRTPADKPGAERAATLGRALERLADDGMPILLSLNPSVMPTYGQPDPVAAVLARFGLEALSGTPILRDEPLPTGRVVLTDHLIIPTAADHPISAAVRNLGIALVWPVALRRTDDGSVGVTIHELLRLDAERGAWRESQWLRLWQTPRAQRPYLPDPPAFDEARDHRDAPWLVAAACERGPLRLVVVGSNNWHVDQVAFERREAEGRLVPAYPGNAELLEASIWWLAGQESLIARSAEAGSTPRIRPLADGDLLALRWALAGGLPLLVLILGAVWRGVRG
ncbi:MAG: hypothetical protein KIS87_07575 [Phycisphaeraceae bacterium]|nr:hypothetical protein [Phycisphaeraceae bacterium]